jgi:orotidine-5'-phosphate decarboxylase
MAKNSFFFYDKYIEVAQKKNSILCVGLDPAIPKQRRKNVISTETRLEFMRKIVEDVSPYASVIKINRQYVIGLSMDQIREINDLIHQYNMLSIIDHKLNDIGSTNDSAMFWFQKEGFDAFTFSPFAGNIKNATETAHKYGLGIIVLTLMSNPEAEYQKIIKMNGKPFYIYIAEQVNKYNSDGCVIGATGHITEDNIKRIKTTIGDKKIVLVPGVGAQGGDAGMLIENFGKLALINVGRAIIYSENPGNEARKMQQIFNQNLK